MVKPIFIFSYIEKGDTVVINGEEYHVYTYDKDGLKVVGLARNQAEFDKEVQEIINLDGEPWPEPNLNNPENAWTEADERKLKLEKEEGR